MNKKKQNTTLSWADFQKLGNPENAPDLREEENTEEVISPDEMHLRIHLEKKGRAGKAVSIIRGYLGSEEKLTILGKELKKKMGVGGSVKDGEIIIQGNKRQKLMEILKKKGYKHTKLSGG